MKNLTLIVHADSRQNLADLLRSQPIITGFTFTHVEGHGAQDEFDPALSARDRVVGYTPRMRVDILLNDEDVDGVLRVLRSDGCGLAGCGIYWITPLEQHGRL